MRPERDFDVFLSHNSHDKEAVRHLKRELEERQVSVWFDEDQLHGGEPIQPRIEQGLKTSGSVAVVITDHGLGPWHHEEMQVALVLAKQLERPIIPVLLPGSPPIAEWPLFLQTRAFVDLSRGITVEGLDRLIRGIRSGKPDPEPLPAKRFWILVAGSGSDEVPATIGEVSKQLGGKLATAGYGLVSGGWPGVDAIVAREFANQAVRGDQPLSTRLVQFMHKLMDPAFPGGRLVIAENDDQAWQQSIERADAVVLIGGLGGTYGTGQLALQQGKPVFPLADIREGRHQDSYGFYLDCLKTWSHSPAAPNLSLEQFQDLAAPSAAIVDKLLGLLRRSLHGDVR